MFISPRFRDIFGADPIKTRQTDQEVDTKPTDGVLADEPEKESAEDERHPADFTPARRDRTRAQDAETERTDDRAADER